MSDVNFTPTRGAYKELTPFRYWCQKVLPLVYDDSISYYELLCKVVNYLNITMEDVSTLNGDVTAMYTAYNELQDFVNQYFTDLNVQRQIDNKLDRMAADGSLNALIDPLVRETTINSVAGALPDVVEDQLPDVVDSQIDDVVGEQIPGVVSQQIQDATDNWLSANISGSNALDSTLTLYGAAARSFSAGTLIDYYGNYLGAENRITAFESGFWEIDNGVMVHPSEVNLAYQSVSLNVVPGDKYTILAPAMIDVYSYVPRYAFTDNNYNIVSVSDSAEQGAVNKTVVVPTGATKLIVNDNLIFYQEVYRVSKMLLVKGELIGTSEISDLKADLNSFIKLVKGDLTALATITNQYMDNVGALHPSANWTLYKFAATDVAYFSEIKTYISESSYGNNFYQVGFYNSETLSSTTLISGIRFSGYEESTLTDVSIPDDTVIVAIANRNSTSENIVIEGIQTKNISNEITEIEETVDTLNKTVFPSENLIPIAYAITPSFVQSSGAISPSGNWRSYWIRTEDITNISHVKTYASGNITSAHFQVAFYSSEFPDNTNFISGIAYTTASTAHEIDNIEIPATAKLIIVTNSINTGSDIVISGSKSVFYNHVDPWEKYDNKFTMIGYSYVNNPHNYVINTAEMYNYVGAGEYDVIKGDVRITSDNYLVMCHDSGFTFDDEGKITSFDSTNNTPIHNLTLSEVRNLIFARQTDSGADMHVPTFEEYIQICKRWGKSPYITIRDEYIDTVLALMFATLDQYNMRSNAIGNSLTYDTLVALRSIDRDMPVTYTVNVQSGSISFADIVNTAKLGNSTYGFFGANGSATTDAALETVIGRSSNGLSIFKEIGVRVFGAIMKRSHLPIVLNAGFSGAQTIDTWSD